MDPRTEMKLDNIERNTKDIITQIRQVKTVTEWLMDELRKSSKTLTDLVDEVQSDYHNNSDCY